MSNITVLVNKKRAVANEDDDDLDELLEAMSGHKVL